MKQVIATRFVDIPDDVEFEVRARKVKVKGPRGEQHVSSKLHQCSTELLVLNDESTTCRSGRSAAAAISWRASGLG